MQPQGAAQTIAVREIDPEFGQLQKVSREVK